MSRPKGFTVLSSGVLLIITTGLFLTLLLVSPLLEPYLSNPLALHGYLLAAEIGCFLLPVVIFMAIRRMRPSALWRGCRASQVALAILMAVCGYMVAAFIQVVWTMILAKLGVSPLTGIFPPLETPWQLLAGFVTISLSAAVSEEVLFRGALLPPLAARNKALAIGLTALVFMAAHGTPQQIPYTFLYGLLLGWLMLRSGSIWPGIAFHAANNAIPVMLQYGLNQAGLMDFVQQSGQAALPDALPMDNVAVTVTAMALVVLPLLAGLAALLWAFHKTSPPAPPLSPMPPARPWHYIPFAIGLVLLLGVVTYHTLLSFGVGGL